MSKSDNTRPRWVRLADAVMVTVKPLHDHRHGPCTLAQEVTAANTDPYLTHGCRWVVTAAFAPVRTDDGGAEWSRQRRSDRRQDRHEARRRLRGTDPDA